MKILVLDDMKERHEAFHRIYDGHEVTSVFKFTQFLNELNSHEWDLIHLDHDLGDALEADTFVDGWGSIQEFNGVHASRHLVTSIPKIGRPKVVIHSINPEGSKRMMETLSREGFDVTWEPFGELSL